MTYADWFGVLLAAALVLKAVHYHRSPSRPRVLRHPTVQSLVSDNLVEKAKIYAKIFSGALHEMIGDDRDIARQVAHSKARNIQILAGPELDVNSEELFRVVAASPRVQLFLIRKEHRTFFERVENGRAMWLHGHFCVVDGQHVCVEEVHSVDITANETPVNTELHNYSDLATQYERKFEDWKNRYAVQINKEMLVEEVQEFGQWVAFAANGKRSEATADQIQFLKAALRQKAA